MMQSYKVDGQLIRELRKKRGWSNAEEFAGVLGLKNAKHFYQIEQGKRTPSLPLLIRISQLLEVSVNLLVEQHVSDEVQSLIDNITSLSKGQGGKFSVAGLNLEVPEELVVPILKIIISYNSYR